MNVRVTPKLPSICLCKKLKLKEIVLVIYVRNSLFGKGSKADLFQTLIFAGKHEAERLEDNLSYLSQYLPTKRSRRR